MKRSFYIRILVLFRFLLILIPIFTKISGAADRDVVSGRERANERERERETDRQTDRQRQRQREKLLKR